MSRDSKERDDKAPELDAKVDNKVEIPANSSKAEKISPEELRQQLLERRAKAGVRENYGDIASLGHDRYIPEGFQGMYVKQSNVERYLERGYAYVRDDNDEVCALKANRDRDATFHKSVLIMAPVEIVEEDQRLDAQRSREACDGVGSKMGS